MNAKPNALVTTDINARLMPGSVVIVRDTDGCDIAFNAVPAEVNGDTDFWVRIDTALRQVGWSAVGAGYTPGPGIADFTAVEATDVVWRRRTTRYERLKPGDQILQRGIVTVTSVSDCYDEHIGAMTRVCTDLDPTGHLYYTTDQVTALVPAGEVR